MIIEVYDTPMFIKASGLEVDDVLHTNEIVSNITSIPNNKMEVELYLANDKNYHAKLPLSPNDIIELKGRVVVK
mgnify:CR=1 FL=1